MSPSDDLRQVHFRAPEHLVERLDAVADLYNRDRADLIVGAVREYIETTAEDESFQDLVATKFYDDQLEFEMVEQLLGAETAQRLKLLKQDLEGESLDLPSPNLVTATADRDDWRDTTPTDAGGSLFEPREDE